MKSQPSGKATFSFNYHLHPSNHPWNHPILALPLTMGRINRTTLSLSHLNQPTRNHPLRTVGSSQRRKSTTLSSSFYSSSRCVNGWLDTSSLESLALVSRICRLVRLRATFMDFLQRVWGRSRETRRAYWFSLYPESVSLLRLSAPPNSKQFSTGAPLSSYFS